MAGKKVAAVNYKQYVEIMSEWSKNFEIGLIRIIKQDINAQELFNKTGSSEFSTTIFGKPVKIFIQTYPEIKYVSGGGINIFLRGSDLRLDSLTLVVKEKDKFDIITQAIFEFNLKLNEEKILII